jgi:hypothetical protein
MVETAKPMQAALVRTNLIKSSLADGVSGGEPRNCTVG